MTESEYNKILDEVAGERAEIPRAAPNPKTTETHHGATPNGGDYSVAYFYDKDGNPCSKARAKSMNIVEYSKDGVRINEAYCVLGK